MVDVASPVQLTSRAVAEICRRHGLPPVPSTRPRWVGATSSVVVVTERVGLKVPHEGAQAVASCRTHARMAAFARSLGVSAPRILAVEEDPALAPVPVFVTSLFPGAALRPGDAAPEIWAAVGGELAVLHAVPEVRVPPGLRTFRQHPQVDPRRLLEELAMASHDALPAQLVARGADLLQPLAADALDHEHPVLCHGDVHAENVIARDGRYVALIDFAGSGVLDASWDFAGISPSAVVAALRGYREAGAATDGLVQRIVWCRVQLALHRLLTPGADREAGVRATLAEAQMLLAH